MLEIVDSPSAAARLDAAVEFVRAAPPGTELLLVGGSREAVDDLVRRVSHQQRATFGLHRFTLIQLAARLAAPALSERGLAPCTRLGAEALAARATFTALAQGRIPYFAPVASCPGFSRTLAASAAELRGAGLDPTRLGALGAPVDQLAALLAAYEAELASGAIADRALLLRTATAAVGAARRDPLVALPLLLLDVAMETRAERELVAALCAAAPRALATVPSGDTAAARTYAAAGAAPPRVAVTAAPASSLERLQRYLFAGDVPAAPDGDDTVRFFSAPGEGREAVEIARWLLTEARAGTPFDAMVVLLRTPRTYTPLLETAFRRAGIPAYFAGGTRRPNPSGRAFLALLACAAEQLSAARFAEYLAFGQVPGLVDGAPPHDRSTWSAPRDEALGAAAAQDGETLAEADAAEPAATPPAPERDPAPEGALRAPWKWEALLVDAAVIGGAERWARRLDGLAHELELQRAELAGDDPEAPRLLAIERQLADLGHLRRFAIPVIERLDAFPERATWGEWLAQLTALAPRVLRQPQAVLAVLAELAPMAAVGPVALDEVCGVLAERLTVLGEDPPRDRYGRVLVTTPDDARGRSFAVVFVPGLAERLFPQRPREDPLLLDALRARLSADLATQRDRDRHERLLLRLAVGAAARRVYLSYPRVDVVQGRPRVTSFYGLDVARATHGGLPDVEAFERAADGLVRARLAWPAPPEPVDAIDASEHDLATIAALLRLPRASRPKGGAQYLVELNPHLGRSLRTRYARWEIRRWTEFDGMSRTTAATAPLLARQRLGERPYSPSALEKFAACPYRFFLAAIQRLEPRAALAPIEQLDPLTRGKLVHRVQAETLRALQAAGALPLVPAGTADAERLLAATLESVAARFADDLAPPIARVWSDEIAALRGDLVYWLRHLAEHGAQWQPAYFEFGFGLPADDSRDPRSRPEPVQVGDGLQLRGSVDLVERSTGGSALRVTDHKTGADRTTGGLVVGGGETLQPVLYGLAVETALQRPVTEGRLFFCTSRGGFGDRVVVLDQRARAQAHQVLAVIDRAVGEGFLPPAPRADACQHCDFRIVCGPYEEDRVGRKDARRLADLAALRQMP